MSDDASRQGTGPDRPDPTGDEPRIVVVTPDGMGVADPSGDERRPEHEDGHTGSRREEPRERERTNPADLVEEPAKVMRIGSMIKQLLEEVRNAPLDEAGRAPPRRRPPPLHRGAQGRPRTRARRRARPDRPALPRRLPHRRRAAHRPGPARRLARGPLPRHPDRARRPADGGAAAAPADARPAAPARAPPTARLPACSRPRPPRASRRTHGPVPLG